MQSFYNCIVSNGFVYSHSDINVNFKRMSFSFKMGEMLHFEYDSINGLLTVTKNNSERFEMKIEK